MKPTSKEVLDAKRFYLGEVRHIEKGFANLPEATKIITNGHWMMWEHCLLGFKPLMETAIKQAKAFTTPMPWSYDTCSKHLTDLAHLPPCDAVLPSDSSEYIRVTLDGGIYSYRPATNKDCESHTIQLSRWSATHLCEIATFDRGHLSISVREVPAMDAEFGYESPSPPALNFFYAFAFEKMYDLKIYANRTEKLSTLLLVQGDDCVVGIVMLVIL